MWGVMTTAREEWGEVREMKERNRGRVRVGFGVHPWNAHRLRRDDAWIRELREMLEGDAEAIVGEIGLDHAAKAPESGKTETEAQEEAFEAQWEVACEMRRPVSVHCVRAHGAMFDRLRAGKTKSRLPPLVSMHSWGGAAEMANQIVRLGLPRAGTAMFFGFSGVINGSRGTQRAEGRLAERVESSIRTIPRESVLIESDMEDPRMVKGSLETIVGSIAGVWGIAEGRAAQQLHENAVRYFNWR